MRSPRRDSAPSARAPRGRPHAAMEPPAAAGLRRQGARRRGRHAQQRRLPRDVQARHGARGVVGGEPHGSQRQVEPQRHVGARKPRLEARGAYHGAQPLPRGAERRAQAHGLLRRGARRGRRRVLPRQALRIAVRGVPRARRYARPPAHTSTSLPSTRGEAPPTSCRASRAPCAPWSGGASRSSRAARASTRSPCSTSPRSAAAPGPTTFSCGRTA